MAFEIDLKGVAGRFSDHAVKRVEDITRAVGIARVALFVTAEEAQERGEPMLDDRFTHLLTTLNGVAPAQLQSWAKRATGLKISITSLVNLMIRYIGLDQKLCEIEPSVRRLKTILDKWEQDRPDEIRGK
jgi:hypothetical protein